MTPAAANKSVDNFHISYGLSSTIAASSRAVLGSSVAKSTSSPSDSVIIGPCPIVPEDCGPCPVDRYSALTPNSAAALRRLAAAGSVPPDSHCATAARAAAWPSQGQESAHRAARSRPYRNPDRACPRPICRPHCGGPYNRLPDERVGVGKAVTVFRQWPATHGNRQRQQNSDDRSVRRGL